MPLPYFEMQVFLFISPGRTYAGDHRTLNNSVARLYKYLFIPCIDGANSISVVDYYRLAKTSKIAAVKNYPSVTYRQNLTSLRRVNIYPLVNHAAAGLTEEMNNLSF